MTNEEPISDGVDGVRTTRMLERAARQRWPIPEKYKQAIIARQVKIATDANSKPREASAAARTIISADRLNMEEEKQAEPQQHLHLHQHQETTVDLSKLSKEKLEELERILLAAQCANPASGAGSVIEGVAVPIHPERMADH